MKKRKRIETIGSVRLYIAHLDDLTYRAVLSSIRIDVEASLMCRDQGEFENKWGDDNEEGKKVEEQDQLICACTQECIQKL